MMKLMSAAAVIAALLVAPAAAQRRGPPPVPDTDISAMSDEFDGSSLNGKWTRFDQAYGWADQVKQLDLGTTTPGALHLRPYHSAWVRDRIAPFLFQTVSGDFDVRARVRVRSANGAIPGGTWSLGGLMARVPNGQKADNWKPNRENWHFITTGVGAVPGQVMTETKGTYNSYSSLKLRPFHSGWVELRLVRVGMTLFALARDEQGKWMVRDRFYRMEQNPAMQVGLIAYTTSDGVPPGPENADASNRAVEKAAPVDMLMDVDWIRFSRARTKIDHGFNAQVMGHPLADPNLSEAAILAALGD